MPLSSHLAPGFVRITYEGTRLPHHQVIPINFADPPTPGVEPSFLPTGGTPVPGNTAISLYLTTAWQPQYPSGISVGVCDTYSVNPTTGVRTFIYTLQAGLVGTNVAAVVPFSEGVWVFKSTVGKPIKVYMMESVYAPGSRNVGAVPADGRQDMIDYVLSSDNIFYGRTNAYPLAFATFTSKTNDVLRRNGGFSDV
jgi:hypothetical protein